MTTAEREELAREREQNLTVDLRCRSCDYPYTGETDDGEPEACPLCHSTDVGRA